MPRFKQALRNAQAEDSEQGSAISPSEKQGARQAAALDFMLESRNLEGVNQRLTAAGIEPYRPAEITASAIQQLTALGGPARQITSASRESSGPLRYLDTERTRDVSELAYPAVLLSYDLDALMKDQDLSPADPDFAAKVAEFENQFWKEAHNVLPHDLHGVLLAPSPAANQPLAKRAMEAFKIALFSPDFEAQVDASPLSDEDKAQLKQVRPTGIYIDRGDGNWQVVVKVQGNLNWPAVQQAFERFSASRPELSWLAQMPPMFAPS